MIDFRGHGIISVPTRACVTTRRFQRFRARRRWTRRSSSSSSSRSVGWCGRCVRLRTQRRRGTYVVDGLERRAAVEQQLDAVHVAVRCGGMECRLAALRCEAQRRRRRRRRARRRRSSSRTTTKKTSSARRGRKARARERARAREIGPEKETVSRDDRRGDAWSSRKGGLKGDTEVRKTSEVQPRRLGVVSGRMRIIIGQCFELLEVPKTTAFQTWCCYGVIMVSWRISADDDSFVRAPRRPK